MSTVMTSELTPNIRPCVGCALTRVLDHIGPNEVIIVITGSANKITNHESVTKQVLDKSVPVHVISYPPTVHTSYLKLARFGQIYAVAENSATIHPLIHLQVCIPAIIISVLLSCFSKQLDKQCLVLTNWLMSMVLLIDCLISRKYLPIL